MTAPIQSVDPMREGLLQKEVSVAIKATPVNDVLRDIAEAAGASLEAAANLRDLKITVFAKEEPAGTLVARIGDVLGGEWEKDGSTLRLVMSSQKQSQRTSYEQAEDRLMRQRIEKGLLEYTGLIKGNQSAPQATGSNLAPEERSLAIGLPIGRMLNSFTSADWAAFWRGEIRTFAPMVGGAPNQPPQVDESQRVVARFDPALSSFESFPGDRKLRTDKLSIYPRPPKDLETMPFAKDVLGWESGHQQPQDDDRFAKLVEPRGPVNSTYYLPAPTMADQLEAFHKGTGIAVVSDAFNVPRLFASQSVSGAAFMQQLRPHGFVKFSEGVVGFRHSAFWRLRRFEVSEPNMRAYELKAQQQPLTLDEYVAFLSRLSPDQTSALRLEGAVVLPFDPRPLQVMLPAMHLYQQLNPAQKRLANSGLAARDMGVPQQHRFIQALLWGALRGGKVSYLGRASAGDLADLGLVIAEQSFETGQKDKFGRAIIGSRQFTIQVGSREEAVRFSAEAKGPPPQD